MRVFVGIRNALPFALAIWALVFWLRPDEPQEVPQSTCIDGTPVIADGELYGCQNGEQSAAQMWTP